MLDVVGGSLIIDSEFFLQLPFFSLSVKTYGFASLLVRGNTVNLRIKEKCVCGLENFLGRDENIFFHKCGQV